LLFVDQGNLATIRERNARIAGNGVLQSRECQRRLVDRPCGGICQDHAPLIGPIQPRQKIGQIAMGGGGRKD
jgi:hypothetical protein